ncbi:Cullin-domain-containing protein [Cristinia sonorae]|uniref:Cullin-domain-containing protein n=1 Tax=Cristinia sonorae TaxID=1940300 RepID=A0A8K0XM51_9AGAR|nr:Cullin-domain-containing protein [Cristinia sonorae]
MLNHRAAHLSFEENHRYGYNLVLFKNGSLLYEGTCRLIVENLEKLVNRDLSPTFPSGSNTDSIQRSQQGETFLKALRKLWEDHTAGLQKLKDILNYMDRVYTKSAGVPEIWDKGLLLFLKHIIHPPISTHIISAILDQIRTERDGFVINRSAVKGCVEVLLQLSDPDGPSVYKRDLEPAFLQESELFYRAEGEKLLESCTAPEYLTRVENRFDSEEARTHHYLSASTDEPLREILKQNLLTPHLTAIMEMPDSGLDNMINLDKLDDLSRLYKLFLKVPEGLTALKKAIKESLIRRGKEINMSSTPSENTDPFVDEETGSKGKGKARARPNAAAQTLTLALKWVQDVLDLKDKFDNIWMKSFRSDRELEGSLNEAFRSFINRNEKAQEFISLFVDDNLKKGLKGKTDTEIDIVLDKTILIFRYLDDKDVFDSYYKGHLAKRLLNNRSISDDAERGMLAKLKMECGHQFTQKLEGMFKDMKVSADTMEAYHRHIGDVDAQGTEISVIVMTSTFWPVSDPSPSYKFPEVLIKPAESYKQFYLSRHSGRRLTWQPAMGNADVRVRFKNDKYHELNVSTFGLMVLVLFEQLGESDFLTYKEIQDAVSISDADLQRTLQSLACAKYKILKKHPPGRDVNVDDAFSFNLDFSAPLYKIKISTVASRVESTDERRETKEKVDGERRYQIEACIMRIMKDRKHMVHNDLINEVTRQLAHRFHPNPLDIKRRIEGLIERDYLERCEDKKSYNYMSDLSSLSDLR